ncbi:hypothetical protein ENSA7_76900 [Enhygromyxa salina]|uniref:Uncharacterized protein n=1 Tax=Enhygromyxa salina TaxID=215803 RepID=A0A2S9XPS0_9BACT|nr:hypothetical protein ENSA7_76900 [Enhygromyxa salina]
MLETPDCVGCEPAPFGQLFLSEPPNFAETLDVSPK